MRRLLVVLVVLLASLAGAQTKIDLPSQAKGAVTVANNTSAVIGSKAVSGTCTLKVNTSDQWEMDCPGKIGTGTYTLLNFTCGTNSSPVLGDFWCDTNIFKYYNGTSTKDFMTITDASFTEGTIVYWDTTAGNWIKLDGNTGSTQCLTETSGGVPSWGTCGGANPAGSGSELQYRSNSTTFGAVTGSSVSGANVTLTGTLSATSVSATTSGTGFLKVTEGSLGSAPGAGAASIFVDASHNFSCVYGTTPTACTFPSGSMVYPGAGIAVSTGAAWDTSIAYSAGKATMSITGNADGTASGLSATLGIGSGGTGQTTAAAAFTALAPTTTSPGALLYWNNGAGAWNEINGNISGTQCLQENSSGVPVWGACGSGTGDVVADTTFTTLNSLTKITDVANKKIGNSLLVDNGTTATYSGTGGVSAPSYTSTGSGIGSLALADSGGTNKAGIQAPSTVTASYNFELPNSGFSAGFLKAAAISGGKSVVSVGTVGLADLPVGTANQILGTNAGATAVEQKTLSTGTTGTDFAIAHAANSITFNLPDASASARGAVTTGAQTFGGTKTFTLPDFTTGFTIGTAAASGKIPRGDGTKFAAADDIRTVCYIAGQDNSAAAALTTSDSQNGVWINELGRTYNIVRVWAQADASSATINLQRDDGTPANILSSALTPATGNGACADAAGGSMSARGGSITCSATLSGTENVISEGYVINFVLASNTSTKRVTVCMKLVAQ